MTFLTDAQRERLMADLDRDGYVVLPEPLPADLVARCLAAIDRIAAAERASARDDDPALRSVKRHNCVDADPALRALMMHAPALQLAYDAFGPMFHLCQSNCISRPRGPEGAKDFVAASPWHADGPRPNLFPAIDGRMGLHYLKFGYFLTDLTHADGGALQVVRGSHRRSELDGRRGDFRIADHAADVVTFTCPAGTAVAFHQAQWHAAPPNRSDIERKNVYISYCPTWMRPLDREPPTAESLAGLSAEERWLLGEPRPAMRWWLPREDDVERMGRYKRAGQRTAAVLAYD